MPQSFRIVLVCGFDASSYDNIFHSYTVRLDDIKFFIHPTNAH